MAVTSVDSAAASTTLLTPGRHTSFVIENTDANRLHVLLEDGTASTTNFSFSLAQNENAQIHYQGKVVGIWAADGTGAAKITTLFTGR